MPGSPQYASFAAHPSRLVRVLNGRGFAASPLMPTHDMTSFAVHPPRLVRDVKGLEASRLVR